MAMLSYPSSFQRFKRQFLSHIWVVRLIVILFTMMIIIGLFILLIKPVSSIVVSMLQGPKAVSTFFTNPLYTLPSYEGRTNVLFLGLGGEDHDGGELTDTILFAALDLKHTEVTMLAIPRDIWVPSLEAKINAAYALGEQEATGSGYSLVEDAVYEITDQPLHYVVSLDFNGFKNLIDALGGIEIEVDRAFTDEKYPIKGKENDECGGDPTYSCRYEVLHFDAGLQTMNGETALKYSRSRHSPGDEGTDFARSQRQQKVITAIKNKLSSKEILLNPKKLLQIKDLVFQYVIFDHEVTTEEYAGFASFGLAFWRSGKEIKTLTLATGDDDNPGFLVNPPIEKYDQWVLEPRNGDWLEFQAFFKQKLRAN